MTKKKYCNQHNKKQKAPMYSMHDFILACIATCLLFCCESIGKLYIGTKILEITSLHLSYNWRAKQAILVVQCARFCYISIYHRRCNIAISNLAFNVHNFAPGCNTVTSHLAINAYPSTHVLRSEPTMRCILLVKEHNQLYETS